jgi:hypothetical protein
MIIIRKCPIATAAMDPADVASLLVLGSAEGEACAFEEICRIARLIAPHDWQPTTEVMVAAADRALRYGLAVLNEDGDTGTPALKTTERGRDAIFALLRKPIPTGDGSFMRACMSAQLCFLHLLPPPDRSAKAAALAVLYADAIAFVRRLQQLPPSLAGSALQDLRAERMRLESELAWVEGMTAWQPLPQAAE